MVKLNRMSDSCIIHYLGTTSSMKNRTGMVGVGRNVMMPRYKLGATSRM